MRGRVIVGVDGSETARKAVRWAAREAKLRGMKLELVSAWEIPMYSYVYGCGFPAISEEMMKTPTEGAEGHLAEALDEALASHDQRRRGRALTIAFRVSSAAMNTQGAGPIANSDAGFERHSNAFAI